MYIGAYKAQVFYYAIRMIYVSKESNILNYGLIALFFVARHDIREVSYHIAITVKYTIERLQITADKIERRTSEILQINIHHQFEGFGPVSRIDADRI